jgi:hypothetical protein
MSVSLRVSSYGLKMAANASVSFTLWSNGLKIATVCQ